MLFQRYRTRVLILGLVSLLPMLGFVLYVMEMQREQSLAVARELLRNVSVSVARDGERMLVRTQDLLQGVAHGFQDSTSDRSAASCENKLRALEGSIREVRNVVFTSAYGSIHCAARPLKAVQEIADGDFITNVGSTRTRMWSNYLPPGDQLPPGIAIGLPVMDRPGNVAGVLVARLDAGAFADSLKPPAGFPEGTVVSLVDRQGTIVTRHPEAFLGKPVPEGDHYRRLFSKSSPVLHKETWLDGIERYAIYQALPRGASDSYTLRIGIPAAAVESSARNALAQGLAAVTASIAIGLFLIWYFGGRYLVQPLKRLADAADHLGRGDYAHRIGVPRAVGEINELATRFDALAGRLELTERARRTLSAGNRTLLRERDEMALLKAMCRVAVESGGYAIAFVGYAREDAAKSVEIVAREGVDDGFLDLLALTWSETDRGQGAVGSAIRSGQTTFMRDVSSDPRAMPWREETLRRGLRSVIALPLRVENRVIGALTLFDREADAFDRMEVELLDEMAADLSFGIETIRARIRAQVGAAELERARTHDRTTGLVNREGFLELVRPALARAATRQEPLAVLVLYVSSLQQFCDSFGYRAADQIAKDVGERLRIAVPNGVVARLDFDEFGLTVPGTDAVVAKRRAEELTRALQSPVRVSNVDVDVRPVIGATFYPGHGDDPEILIRRAALSAREAARRELHFLSYQGGMAMENPERIALAGELRRAIEERSMTLHYQPKRNFGERSLAGVEALLRWHHPSRGMVSPGQFVPIAEQTGMIRQLTDLVLEQAVRQQHEWLKAGHRVRVAVNLSARNLEDPGLCERIEGLLSTWGVPAELLDFELVESALVEDPRQARDVVARLKAFGGRVYIDDFGTGYSSLSYLVSLPAHGLKIDRSFVMQMVTNPQARAVVLSIVKMAHSLGLTVVAEGVENETEESMLREMGCDQGQGYYYAKPGRAEDIAATHFGPGMR